MFMEQLHENVCLYCMPILYVADCILMSRQNYFRFDVVIKKVVNNIETYAKFAFITTVPVENK